MEENVVIKEELDNELSVSRCTMKVNKCRPAAPLHNSVTHHRTKAERYIRQFCICQEKLLAG